VILSKHFVFLHLPKTGGSFVRELCVHYAPAEWQCRLLDNHPTIRDIPPEYADLPAFGFVRNPYDWYVSWYYYLKKRGDNAFFNQASDHGRKGFKETMLAAFEADIAKLYGFDCQFSDSAYGCYMNYMFGNDLDRLQLGKFERLRDDLYRIWSSMVELPAEMKTQIRRFPKVNESRREQYRAYYDSDLRAVIERKDRAVMDRFEYEF